MGSQCVGITNIVALSKTLSENCYFGEDQLSTSQMKKSQIVLHFLLPAHLPRVLPWDRVDKSLSPFQAHFGQICSSVDSPDRHLTLA